jgi:hypothetical protein
MKQNKVRKVHMATYTWETKMFKHGETWLRCFFKVAIDNTTTLLKELSLKNMLGGCIPFPNKTCISSIHYLLVVDINGLLCDAR